MIKWRRHTGDPSRSNFFYLRVDDRLIHGQVVVGWGSILDVNCLVLANDRIASNSEEREFYRQIIPESMCGSVESMSQALQHFPREDVGNCRCLVVVASVDDALRWIDAGKRPDAVILGGLHAQEGRRRILDYLYLSETEIATLQVIENKGINLICRDLPTSDFITFRDALRNAR
jgi:mannose/fructose/N-acetylgalactosamine-specific phosphotransferase system component IIB